MSIVLLILISLFPALCWLGLYASQDTTRPERKKLLLLTFLLGGSAILPFFLARLATTFLPIGTPVLPYLGVVLFAFLEECAKLIPAFWVMNKYPTAHDEITDGIMYAVASALGFAMVENILYFSQLYPAYDMSFLVIGRSVMTMLAHTIFSSIAGYAYALAYIRPLTHIIKKRRNIHLRSMVSSFHLHNVYFHVLASHILRFRQSKEGHDPHEIVIEGVLLASCMHAIYNIAQLIWSDLIILFSLLIVAFLVIMFMVRHSKQVVPYIQDSE